MNVRLPKNIIPDSYSLYLIPYLIPDNFTISGVVFMNLTVVEPSTNITVHINDMTIHEKAVTVTDAGGILLPVTGHGYDSARQFYIIQLGSSLPVGQLSLSIDFTGNLNDDLAGFYRSRYTDVETGEEKWLATTQFE